MEITRAVVDKMSDEECLSLIHYYVNKYGCDGVMQELLDENYLYIDILDASSGKRHHRDVMKTIGTELDSNTLKDKDGKVMKTIRHIQLELISLQYIPRKPNPRVIHKPDGKDRIVAKAPFQNDAIIQRALIRVLLPRFYKGMYKYSCACVPGRGTNYARKGIKRTIKNDPKNTKYVLVMDIRHCFESISHRRLKKKLRKIIKEPWLRKILFRIIDSYEEGLPLGYYTSHWFMNFFLQDLDHYIKERILDDCGCNTKRTGRHGAVYYWRYADDMVIFGPNKKELHKIKNQLDIVMEEEFGLRIKYNWQVFRFDYIDKNGVRRGRFLDFVGFRFYHDHITIRRKTYIRIVRLANRMIKKGIEEITFKQAARMLSFYGLVYWSDAHGLYVNLLKPYIKLSELKEIVKKEMQRKAAIIAERELEDKTKQKKH